MSDAAGDIRSILSEEARVAPRRSLADEAAEALSRFKGIERRLEKCGDAGGILVMDDYAHNPAKIEASLRAMQACGTRVHAIWRPHGFGPLKLMMDDLVEMFLRVLRTDDRLYLLPVYYAGGTVTRDIESQDLVDQLFARDGNAQVLPDYGALHQALTADLCEGDVVMTMGARDPGLREFAYRVASELSS